MLRRLIPGAEDHHCEIFKKSYKTEEILHWTGRKLSQMKIASFAMLTGGFVDTAIRWKA